MMYTRVFFYIRLQIFIFILQGFLMASIFHVFCLDKEIDMLSDFFAYVIFSSHSNTYRYWFENSDEVFFNIQKL
jgi:hypothetical protein